MWQTIIVLLVTAFALFFVGRMLYRQIRRAIDPSQDVSCSCSGGCSACNISCNNPTPNKCESDR